MSSAKASSEGRALIKQAIAQKGWRVRDDRWLVAASYRLEPEGDWRPDGPYAYGCSLQTWERFLQGVAVRDRSFVAFCKVLRLQPSQVAEPSFLKEGESGSIRAAAQKSPFANLAGIDFESTGFEEINCPSARSLLTRIASLEDRVGHLESLVERQPRRSML